jgi:hypothetical protein
VRDECGDGSTARLRYYVVLYGASGARTTDHRCSGFTNIMIWATFQSSFHILIHSTILANFYINCRGFAFTPTNVRATTGRISVGASLAFSTPNIRVPGGVSPLIEGKLKSVSNTVHSEGSSKLSLLSPCKINLFLRIERRRPDGYHDLASLFQAIGLGDTLNMELLPSNENEDADDIFTCNMEGIPTDQSNLVLRAVNLMRMQTGYTQKVRWGRVFADV